ncbi:MAG: hypothetical protein AAF696_21160 [Bacteroidota bacterium]
MAIKDINDSGEIRRLFRPLIRSWWFIVFMAALGSYQGYQAFLTQSPSFQARATIQVHDKNTSGAEFLEHFEAFSLVGEFLFELDILRSTYLIRQAVERLPLKMALWESRPLGWHQYYKQLPIYPRYSYTDSIWLDREITLDVHADQSWEMSFEEASGEQAILKMKAGEVAAYAGMKLSLEAEQKGESLKSGTYKIIIRSDAALMEIFADMDNLLVRLQDEHVGLINIYYWHPVPALATDFVNELAAIYIVDFVKRKKEMALRALKSLKIQLSLAENKLEKAEMDLYQFRDDVSIWEVSSYRKLHLDILAEAETRKLNTHLKIKDLENLSALLYQLNQNLEAKLNYESIRDRGYLDALEQIADLQKELARRKLNLTAEHPLIIQLTQEINQIINDLSLRVKRTLETYKEVYKDLGGKISRSGGEILRLPLVEQKLAFLERNVAFRQRTLDSLNLKTIDAYVSSMSDFSFHRILEHELVPEEPIKPLFHVKVGVSALMYTLMAIFLLLFLKGGKGLITHPEEALEDLELPIRCMASLEAFPQKAISQGMINLATDLILDGEVNILSIIDYQNHPDKRTAAFQLAYVFAELGKRVLVLQTSSHSQSSVLSENFPGHELMDILEVGEKGGFPAQVVQHKDWGKSLEKLRQEYDYLIFLVDDLRKFQDTLPFLGKSQLCLYAAGLYRTKVSWVKKVQSLLEENQLREIELFLLENPNLRISRKLLARVQDFFEGLKR